MLRQLPAPSDPRLLVGTNTADDAGVFKLSAELALVQTVDFFTPVVDDPYWFGAIAAANALSDVYAMGGIPLTALNIVGFPVGRLSLNVLTAILRGGSDKAREADVTIVGGHTVDDAEPKYGLAVTGTIHPGRIVTNAGAQPGDALVLTKPLGSGIATTAIKSGKASDRLQETVIAVMAQLNRAAAEAMIEVGVHAATDITGFGLLGHLAEMAAGSGLQATIAAGNVPVLEEVPELASQGEVPGGTRRNLASLDGQLLWESTIAEPMQLILGDAQTSGGLLIAVAQDVLATLLAALSRRQVHGAVIGRLDSGIAGAIRVTL